MQKLIVVESTGLLPISNGNIVGPVMVPFEVSLTDAIKIVSMGHKVYEINPENSGERVLLTSENVRRDNFNMTTNILRAAATRISPSTKTNIMEKVQLAAEIETNVKRDVKKLAETLYNKDGSIYLLEGDAYTHYESNGTTPIEYGITIETLETMIKDKIVSETKVGERLVSKKKSTKGKGAASRKKKSPNPQSFKKD